MNNLTKIYKALGEPIRLRILLLLMQRDSLCVCDLVETLQLPQSTVSRHLSTLKAAGILKSWREGTWMLYAIEANGLDAFNKAFLENFSLQDEQTKADLKSLIEYEQNPDKCRI